MCMHGVVCTNFSGDISIMCVCVPLFFCLLMYTATNTIQMITSVPSITSSNSVPVLMVDTIMIMRLLSTGSTVRVE